MKVIDYDVAHGSVNTHPLEDFFKEHGELTGKRTDQALVEFTMEHAIRRMLPYGKWTCKDGREVLFNREYQTIAQRVNGVVSYMDRNEWIKDIATCEHYYLDHCTPSSYIAHVLGVEKIKSKKEISESRKSLLVSLAVLREFTPKESGSVNEEYSLLNHRIFG